MEDFIVHSIVQWHPQIRIPRNYFKTRGVPSSHIGSILKKIKTWNPFREKEKLPELEWPIIYDDMGKFRRIDYNKVKYGTLCENIFHRMQYTYCIYDLRICFYLHR